MLTTDHLQSHHYQLSFDSEVLLITNIAYDGNGNPEYIGKAAPGSGDGTGAWLIKKITSDPNGNPTAVRFAGGQAEFNKVWDDRAAYVYS